MTRRPRLTVSPHDHQPSWVGVLPRLDPCRVHGCGMPPAHAIHHTDTAPVRDHSEPIHQREDQP